MTVETPERASLPPGLPDDVSPLGVRAAPKLRALGVAIGVLAVLLIISAIWDAKQFAHSYLFGYVFALDISLGALFWVLIHHVSGAGWSVGLRRVYENITRAIPYLAVLFIPVLIGIYSGNLHDWQSFISGSEPEDAHLQHQWHVKHLYFSAPFFIARLALYFGVWIVYSSLMRRFSEQQDSEGGSNLYLKMRWWAPSGTLLLGLTATFFAFDVLMSLQYSWFSTIYGVYFWVGGIRGSMSLAVLIVIAMHFRGLLARTITMEHLHDVGKMMFGFTVFWAYIAFSQYFLIWYGNMPEETQYYTLRRQGGWYEASILLPILNFGVPFFLLLPRSSKRNPRMLAIAAAWILAMHAYDLFWQVMPVLYRDTIRVNWADLVAPVFTLSVVLFATLRGMQRVPLIPIRDPYLNETIGYENETP